MSNLGDSNAWRFFNRFVDSSDRAAFIRSLQNPAEPVFEAEWLDFKSGNMLDDRQTKKYWSESLAAFANTEGGVLIFGVECRKTTSPIDPQVEIDAVSGFSPVQEGLRAVMPGRVVRAAG